MNGDTGARNGSLFCPVSAFQWVSGTCGASPIWPIPTEEVIAIYFEYFLDSIKIRHGNAQD